MRKCSFLSTPLFGLTWNFFSRYPLMGSYFLHKNFLQNTFRFHTIHQRFLQKNDFFVASYLWKMTWYWHDFFSEETRQILLQPYQVSSQKHHAIKSYDDMPECVNAHFWVPPYLDWLEFFFRDTPWWVVTFYIKTFY